MILLTESIRAPKTTVVVKLIIVANIPISVEVDVCRLTIPVTFMLMLQEDLVAIAAAVQNRTTVEVLRSAIVKTFIHTLQEVIVAEAAAVIWTNQKPKRRNCQRRKREKITK